MTTKEKITIETTVHAPVAKVWQCWTEPDHITQWSIGSEDWHTPRATNDVRVGGTFNTRMEAKDASQGFDFSGTYTDVVPQKRIAYIMSDGRTVTVDFEVKGDEVHIVERFDPESEHSVEAQRQGWQGILDRFKAHVEAH